MKKLTKPTNQKPITGPDASNSASAGKERTHSLWMNLLLSLVSVVVFFLLLEGGLALFGVQPVLQTEDPFVGFASNVPLFVSDGGTEMVTAPNRLPFFNFQSFPLDKAPGTYRIFCLGGSTTYGRPYNDLTSFPGWLREILPVADKSNQWEVINAGGISYASYRVAHLMEELVRYQPDLFVVYTGHNEFLEERTYGNLREVPESLRRLTVLLARTRSWSAIDSVLKETGIKSEPTSAHRTQLAGEVNTILDRSAGPERYQRDDPLRDNILLHFRNSLEHMAELARNAGAKIIFITPASNLKDCSPFKSEHSPGLEPAAQLEIEKLLSATGEAMIQGRSETALKFVDRGLQSDPRNAQLYYRRGQALLALDHFDEAEVAFRLARDEDVCPLRALTPVRQIVTDVAREQEAPLIDFVDIVQNEMQKRLGYPIPGDELFLDHVHPTIEGNRILALALISKLIDSHILQPDVDWGQKAIAEVVNKIDGSIDAGVQAMALANLARVMIWAGKIEDAERLAVQALDNAGENPEVSANAIATLTSIAIREGDPERAIDLLLAAIKSAPDNIELRFKLGVLQLDPPLRQYDKAAANLLLASQKMPLNDMAHLTFGLAMAKRGRVRVAYASFLEALRLNPENNEAKRYVDKVELSLRGRIAGPPTFRVIQESYPSGAPHKMIQVNRGSNARDGIEVEWYENGQVSRLLDIDQGQLNGSDIIWDRDGKVLSRIQYRSGKPVVLGEDSK